jgi:hypothetical protein
MVKRAQPFSLRVDEASLLAYKKAAEQAGMSVSEWARLVLDVSAGVRQIRHVYFIDVGKLEPDEAIRMVEDTAKKVRTGKW